MRNLEKRVEMAVKSSHGEPMGIEAIGAATLAWEMAMLAQSCAYLAEEAQIWAQNCVDQKLTSPESTYRRLLDSTGTFRRLLDVMHRTLHAANSEKDSGVIFVLNEPLVGEIRYMLGLGLAITMEECMTSTESQETSSTDDAGDTR